ncbi:MAG: hypothetical protein ACYSW8_29755 [Planctomycetota bacterium]|jgi:hypothetical protein
MDILTCRLPENKPLAIAPLGDIQYGNEGCSLKLLKEHLEWIDEDYGTADLRFIGTGDYIDLMSPSNRDRYKASGLYNSARRAIDATFAEYVQHLAELLKPHLEGKVTTLCRGHHWMGWEDDEWLFQNHPELTMGLPRDSDRYLSFLLGSHTNSAGNVRRNWGVTEKVAYVSYVWPNGKRFNVLAFHGEGNGATLTYTLNKLDKFAGHWDDVDCIVMGHTHKLGGVPKQKLRGKTNASHCTGWSCCQSLPRASKNSYINLFIRPMGLSKDRSGRRKGSRRTSESG